EGSVRGPDRAPLERSGQAVRPGARRGAAHRGRAGAARSQARAPVLRRQRRLHHPRPDRRQDRRQVSRVPERQRAAAAAHFQDLPGNRARQEEVRQREQGVHQSAAQQRQLDDSGDRTAPADDAQGDELHRGPAARVLREGHRSSEAPDAARGGRRDQHAREHGQPRDEREVRADAARLAAAQVLLLERAVDHDRGRRERPLDQVADSEDGERRAAQKSADGSADCRDVRAQGGAYRPPHRRQVSRSARHSARADAQAAVSLATNSTQPDVSVLVPAKDEADNLAEFVRLTREALLPLPYACELVIVNDGSQDGTPQLLEELKAKHPFLRVVTHRTQRGIADALRSASDVARGRVLVFYPADLQYLPADIPSLVAPILAGQADIVTGTKQGQYEKRFVSSVYNGLSRWLFGVRVNDLNSVKAYRREVMESQPTRPDWHRFMVVIAASQGFRLAQQPVPLYPRRAGSSKFGIGRIPVGALDLMSVWFQLRFGRKPMLF